MSGIGGASIALVHDKSPLSCFAKNPTTYKSRKSRTYHSHPTTIFCQGGFQFDNRRDRSSSPLTVCNGVGEKQSQSQSQPSSLAHWDWERWEKHFSEIEEHEVLSTVLKSQLDDAVKLEDFQEASRLKKAIETASTKDLIFEVMAELKKSIEEERYQDAVRLRDDTGAGLVGWWAGIPQGSKFSFGLIIHISPSHGRFLARVYHPRSLSDKVPGKPFFEIFLTKDDYQRYKQQAVYLKRIRDKSKESVQITQLEDDNLLDASKIVVGTTKDISPASSVDEIPGLKFKILKVIVPEGADTDKRVLEELIQMDDEAEDEEMVSSAEVDDDVKNELFEDESIDSDTSIFVEKSNEYPKKFLIEGVLQSDSEEKGSHVSVRVPARIEYKDRDAFVFHIEDAKEKKKDAEKENLLETERASSEVEASIEDTADDVAKVLLKVGITQTKAINDIKEIIKFAMSQSKMQDENVDGMTFRRMNTQNNGDSLTGLYIGASAFNIAEVIELRRRYGQWSDEDGKDVDLQFFEYIEVVKLSGDLFVPAGEVAFRAKIGKGQHSASSGYYPEELGVIARYQGQGRIAKPGFKNPQWIDGEMLLLDGKGPLKGARLGFFYSTPSPHYLKLFNQLKLSE